MEASPANHTEHPSETRVGIREVRHDFRAWLERAQDGERIVITDRGRPAGVLGPYHDERSRLQRMYDEGMVIRATRSFKDMPPPHAIGGEVTTIVSDALREDRKSQR